MITFHSEIGFVGRHRFFALVMVSPGCKLIRNLLSVALYEAPGRPMMNRWLGGKQGTLFPSEPTEKNRRTSSTFIENMALPVHRWFRYSAGFSAGWVADVIEREKATGRRRVLDPFAGSGTVLLEGEWANLEAIGVEAHPFVARVACAKMHWRESASAFADCGLSVLERGKSLRGQSREHARLTMRCFPPAVLSRLDRLLEAWASSADGSPLSELTWLALVSILRECSPVGTAQWQYVLPNKAKARVVDPYEAFHRKLCQMADDMTKMQRFAGAPFAEIHLGDARACSEVPEGWADLVITSPPYANNYDYADATRLEMTFLGEIAGWGDLQEAVRKRLVCSCTQHAAMVHADLSAALDGELLNPIRTEIVDTCGRLEGEREKHGGRKPYHEMICLYFEDLANVWRALRRVTGSGCLVCFVVGDSAPYGIHVPVQRWLGELALAAGFTDYSFEKTRDRNVKWKNRKHRVPLLEGRLWVKG